MRRKLLAMITLMCFMFTLVPVAALAADEAAIIWTGTVEKQTITGGTENDPVVITVDGEVSVTGEITISSGHVVIKGTDKSGDILKRSGYGGNLIYINKGANLTIEDLTVDGGAVWTGEIDEVLKRGTVNSGETATTSMIKHADYCTLTIKNSVLQNNAGGAAVESGGGTRSGNKVLIENCKLINNKGGAGAAIFAYGFTIKNSEIAYNDSENGAIRVVGGAGTNTVSGGSIHNNYSSKDGGAIYASGGDLVLENVPITDNVSATEDGAMYFAGSVTLTLNNATVTRNSAPKHGGIHVWTASVNFIGTTTVADNTNGNFYIHSTYNRTFKVDDTIGKIDWSWNLDPGVEFPKFTKNSDSTDLTKVIAKLPYEGVNESDKETVLFIDENEKTINVATIILNGGSISSIYTTEKGVLPTPARENKVFAGWYTDEELTMALSGAPAAGGTYYAKWADSKITFDGNGADNDTMEIQYADISDTLTQNNFTRTGYIFNGWNTKADGTGIAYKADDKINENLKGEHTLYAQWTPITYTIAFNANGGTGTMQSIPATYDKLAELTACAFTKTGYKFAGWSLTNENPTMVYANGTKVRNLTAVDGATVTFYAIWTQLDVHAPDMTPQTFDYDGTAKAFEPSDSDCYTITYMQNGVEVTPINAGVYDVVLKCDKGETHAVYHNTIIGGLVINRVGSTATPGEDANFSGTYGDTITLSVNVAKAEAAAIDLDEPAQDKVAFYCGGTLLGEAAVTYTDDTKTSGTTSLTYDTSKGGIPVGTNSITAKYSGGLNLLGSDGTITVNLAPQKLTVTELIAEERVYDGTTAVTVTGGVLDGVIGADVVSVGTVSANAEDKNVGENKAVDISNVTLTGKDADNYVVTPYPTNVKVTITPALLTATYEGETIKFGEEPALAVSVTGFVNGETAETAANYTAPVVTNDNTKIGTYTLTPTGGSADNYAFDTYVSGTLTILQASTPVTPSDTVTYIVEHYKGDTLAETEYFSGKISDTVTAVPNEYDGYTYNAAKSTASAQLKAIASDTDIVVLQLYYDAAQQPDSTPTTGSSSFSGSYNYPVSTPVVSNGSAILSDSNATEGESVTITTKPNNGYGVAEVIVTDQDGNRIPVEYLGNGQYTFVMPDGKVNIETVYKPAITLTVGNPNVNVFGKTIKNDAAPIIQDSRTMLPIRVIAEALGADVDWNADTQKVTITKDGKVIELYIGKTAAYINGAAVQLDTAAFIDNSRTYLPVRFISEALDAMVNWDAVTRTVTVIPE